MAGALRTAATNFSIISKHSGEEDGARGDHFGAALEAVGDREVVAPLVLVDRDRAALELPLPVRRGAGAHEDDRLIAEAEQGGARDGERLPLGDRDRDGGV